jgi:hypothetical protein
MAQQEDELRRQAVSRIKAVQGFKTHAAAYVVVNLFLVGVWAVTSREYFWPTWSVLGWGIGLFFNWWAVYRIGGITEDRIQAEMERLRSNQGPGA